MKKVILTAILFCLCSASAFAQTEGDQASSGSVYSRIGVGLPVDLSGPAANGMGLIGVSFSEPYVPGLANPAQWGSTVYGMGTGGLNLTNFKATDASAEARNTSFGVNQFQLQLPLIRGELGISASFSPVTTASYRTYRQGMEIFESGAVNDTLIYEIDNRGSGGINRAELGFGWEINSNISVGYAGSLIFASIKNDIRSAFLDQSYQTVSYQLRTSGIGFGHRFGTYLSFPQLFSDQDQLNLGFTASLPVQLNAERIQETNTTNQTITIEDGPALGKGNISLPMTLSGGLSYRPFSRLMIATEGLYERWSDFENEINTGANSLYKDRYKIGGGLSYFPYFSNSDKFLSNFKYRLGTSYDSGHLQIDGQSIETLKFSFGLGIPAQRSASSIDISFDYGFRGTNAGNLVKEQIWGIRLSLNLAERMFYIPRLQ